MKMKSIVRGILAQNQKHLLTHKVLNSSLCPFDFASTEEILENHLPNHIILIGINLPDSKNKLTEVAAEKLCDSLKRFFSNDEFSVAVLHGIGGNFCSGIIETEKAVEHGKEIIKVLHEAKKPVIGTLYGRVVDIGFQIAIMCDLRVVDETCFMGFGPKTNRFEVSPVVFQKLVNSVGIPAASQCLLTSTNITWNQAYNLGFASKVSPNGAALGDSINWARNIGLTPLDKIKEEKAIINNCLRS